MIPRPFPLAALSVCAGAFLLTSCREPAVRVYLAPRDATPAPQAAAHVHNPNDPNDRHDDEPAPAKPPERPRPQISYTLPEGWTKTEPGQVSIAAFAIKKDGAEAAANVTPLPDLRGREAMVVNMYRQQTGQPTIEQDEVTKSWQNVEAAGGEGHLLEFLGSNAGKATRLVIVIAHREGRSWFYRIAGDDALVTAQKPTFLEFIKSVKITDAAPAAPTPAAADTPAPAAAPAATAPAPAPKNEP